MLRTCQTLFLSSTLRLPSRPTALTNTGRPSRGLALSLLEHLLFCPDVILSLTLGWAWHWLLSFTDSATELSPEGPRTAQCQGTALSSIFLLLPPLPPPSTSSFSSSPLSSQHCLDPLPFHASLPGPGPCLGHCEGRNRDDFSSEEVSRALKDPETHSPPLHPPHPTPATAHKVSCFGVWSAGLQRG